MKHWVAFQIRIIRIYGECDSSFVYKCNKERYLGNMERCFEGNSTKFLHNVDSMSYCCPSHIFVKISRKVDLMAVSLLTRLLTHAVITVTQANCTESSHFDEAGEALGDSSTLTGSILTYLVAVSSLSCPTHFMANLSAKVARLHCMQW